MYRFSDIIRSNEREMMEEEDWKLIIDELTEQVKVLSIERAVARKDVRRLSDALKAKTQENEAMKSEVNNAESKVFNVTNKE